MKGLNAVRSSISTWFPDHAFMGCIMISMVFLLLCGSTYECKKLWIADYSFLKRMPVFGQSLWPWCRFQLVCSKPLDSHATIRLNNTASHRNFSSDWQQEEGLLP